MHASAPTPPPSDHHATCLAGASARNIAMSIFTLGALASIGAAAKLPAVGSKWPTTLPLFIIGAVLSVAGVVVWRMANRARAVQANHDAANGNGGPDPVRLLAALLTQAHELSIEMQALDAHALCKRIDALSETYVLPFAEARERITDRFGMAHGADILCTVAYAERMLNRTWSATADGHRSEAMACYPEALAAFEDAAQKIRDCKTAPH